jgi:HEAT repeat protein
MLSGFAVRLLGPAGQPVLRVARILFFLLPGGILLVASLRSPPQHSLMLWMGTAFQFLVCFLSLVSRQSWRQPLGPSLITLYVIGLGWLYLGTPNSTDWFPHAAQATLLVVPLLVFAQQVLTESGASAHRRARMLGSRLASRKEWPASLAACRSLPEVKAFREALHVDPTPALALLTHGRAQVRVAALAALEFRPNWRRDQAEMVLQVAQRAQEPEVRASAIMALGNVEDRLLIETLAEFLRDPAWEVRRAATEALLWDSEHRWSWLRHPVRRALGDPAHFDDGPLSHDGQMLTAEAVADLTAWASEKGLVGQRAAWTLGAHYTRVLNERPDDELIPQLCRQLADPKAPSALRLELATLLRNTGALDKDLLKKLLEPSNPAPVRLIAVEGLLAGDSDYEARAALRDLARLPNREIALATADVVQRRLGVDLGLTLGQPLPPIHTRHAAEVARKIMMWAAQFDQPCLRD